MQFPQGRKTLMEKFQASRFMILLISLLLLLCISPFLEELSGLHFALNISYSVVLVSSLFALSHKKWIVGLSTALVVPMFLMAWLPFRFPGKEPLAMLIAIFYFTLVVVVIFRHVFRTTIVDRETILAAMVIYMGIGVVWSYFYQILEFSVPGSFSLPAASPADLRNTFYYFSFTTLTTLGFGDITPLSEQARGLAIVEAVTGQIYLTVMVARLVGMHISQSLTK